MARPESTRITVMASTSTPDRSEWTAARLDALARALMPVLFPGHAPAPAPAGSKHPERRLPF
jgi:hypothetical protein